ncbi:sulfatase [Pollutibacter soli]|uniref:sulfatase family protein n=1 Tax=Pollutibacter soli TaxID=3034157 RepID=UPI003013B38F
MRFLSVHRHILPVIFLFLLTVSVSAQSSRPNIILIVSEDNGPELSCYGEKVLQTPFLDKLAQEGVRFTNAYTTYSLCSPSRSSIFTGLYPHQNGQTGLATHKYHMYPGIKTLPVFLQNAGYRTGIIGKIHVNPESEIPFDFHAIDNANFARKNMMEYIRQSQKFMNASDSPFFLMVNFPDAHYPLVRQAEGMPAKPIDGKDLKTTLSFVGTKSDRLLNYTADYYNSMERMDELCGRLFKAIDSAGKSSNTLIIYLGDHGAQFSRGKESNYEGGMKIPLIMGGPLVKNRNSVNNDLVSVVDLLPTIMDFASKPVTEKIAGHSLRPILEDVPDPLVRKYLATECDGGTSIFFYPTRGIRNHRYKLIHNLRPGVENPKYFLYARHFNEHFYGGTEEPELRSAPDSVRRAYYRWHFPPEYELYDLDNDPAEWNDLAEKPEMQQVLRELKKALQQWQKETRDPLADPKLLKAYIDEMEAVKVKYPNHGYQKNKEFEWKFTERFEEYVRKGRRKE